MERLDAPRPPSSSPQKPSRKKRKALMNTAFELEGLEAAPASGSGLLPYGTGPTEQETRLALAEIEAARPLTGAMRTIKQLCISLAMSIDKGNNKGRAIANEAAQLFAMMQQLDPPEADTASTSNLSPELERLFNVFAAAPSIEPAPAWAVTAPRPDDTQEGDAPQL